MQPIGVFGGTFDPIHCGHLRTAFELWQELRLAEVRFLPTGSPPHRAQLYASPERRLQMVRAAVADQPSFVVDDREVRRSGVSYSVDTLTELRREYPGRSLCLLLGMDAFLGLPNWHRWRDPRAARETFRVRVRACRDSAGDFLDRAAFPHHRRPRPALPRSRRGEADHPRDEVLCCPARTRRPLKRGFRRTHLST